MGLEIGIIGLPNVGKSTLFNALASRRLAETAPRPFTTIDPHEAVVPVPDPDFEKLYELVTRKIATSSATTRNDNKNITTSTHVDVKKVPATVTFIDIAGLVKGAHKGEGLGNQFLGKIREVDAIIHVVRGFYDPNVTHTDQKYEMGSIDQITEDIELINIELELGEIKEKPTLIVVNVGENDIASEETKEKIIEISEKFKVDVMVISAKLEEELIDFGEGEKLEFLKSAGIEKTGLENVVARAHEMLSLINFYTIKGGVEVTAWNLKNGSSAMEAAEKVHTDFAKNFIKAEVVEIEKLFSAGSWKIAKEKGFVRLEGKEYAVRDGDVVEFKVGK